MVSHRKQRISQYFSRANRYTQYAIFQRLMIEHLVTRLNKTPPARLLEIGAGNGLLTEVLYQQYGNCCEWVINELSSTHSKILQQTIPKAKLLIGDAETLDWQGKYDLIISANCVQWFDAPLNFINRAFNALNDDGTLLFNTYLPSHYLEIKELLNIGLNYPSTEDWQRHIKQYFSHTTLEVFQQALYFPSPKAVLHHIQATGVGAAGEKRWSKAELQQFYQNYQRQFSGPDGVRLTQHALIIKANK